MRTLALLTIVCICAGFAHAQQIDVAVGIGGLLSSKYNTASQAYLPATEKGGTYPSFSADVIFKNRLGINGEVAVRAQQGLYNGYQGFRPILYDVNALFAPQFGEKATAEFTAGIGGESIRFYDQFSHCYYQTCLTHVSSNHFLAHAGAGFRYYFWHSFFIRPEAHLYWIDKNTQFSSNFVGRVGASVGYTFGPK